MDRRTVIKALMGGLAFPVVPIQIEAAAKKLNRRIILIELQGANDGLNTSMFCFVLDWTDYFLLRRHEYQRSYCWSCYCHLPDKDSPRIDEESSHQEIWNREAHAKGSILVGGNSN